MNPAKLLSLLVGLVIASFGLTVPFGTGIAFEHRPAGWPNFHVHGPFGCCTLHLPDGPYARLAADEAQRKAWAAALDQCHANGVVLQRAIDGQNSAVEALSAQSVRLTAANAQAVQAARSANARAISAETSILAPLPATDDVCARAQEVDRRLLETLP